MTWIRRAGRLHLGQCDARRPDGPPLRPLRRRELLCRSVGAGAPFYIPIVRDAFAQKVVQAVPVRKSLIGKTDVYYRGWDLNTPDQYRFEEWNREFNEYVKKGDLPSFEMVDFMEDHFGNFSSNAASLENPLAQMASNDYAVGRLVEAVSNSPYWKDTAIFVVEDDAQNGPDHVDAHRSTVFMCFPLHQ
jgi:hypothetical protein